MKTQHLMRWRCTSRDHRVQIFDTDLEFQTHMKEQHAGKFTDDQLETYTESNAYPMGSIFDSCPFCGETDGRLEEHVACHLRNIALRALPWPEDAGSDIEEDTKNSGSESSANLSRSTLRSFRRLLPLSNIESGASEDDEPLSSRPPEERPLDTDEKLLPDFGDTINPLFLTLSPRFLPWDTRVPDFIPEFEEVRRALDSMHAFFSHPDNNTDPILNSFAATQASSSSRQQESVQEQEQKEDLQASSIRASDSVPDNEDAVPSNSTVSTPNP